MVPTILAAAVLLCLGAVDHPLYDLDVWIDPPSRHLEVRGTVRIPAAAAAGGEVRFGLASVMDSLRVEIIEPAALAGPVALESQPLGSRGRTTLWTVRPPVGEFPAGAPIVLEFAYSSTGAEVPTGYHVGPEGSFAVGLDLAWYPQFRPGDRGLGELRFEVPAGHTVIATGEPERPVEGEGLTRFAFEVTRPSPFSFAAARYVSSRRDGPVEIGVHLLRPRASVERLLDGQEKILAALETEFGPTPYGRLAVVEVPHARFPDATAKSAEGLIFVREDILPDTMISGTGILLPFLAHEIAHQWWGNTVHWSGPEAEFTLTEAMANYAALRAVETLEGPDAAERFRREGYPGYDEARQSGAGYLRSAATGRDAPLTAPPDDYDLAHGIANSKGSLVWWALAREIGLAAFRAGAKDALRAHAWGEMTLDEALAALASRAGRDLTWFAEQWFQRSGFPAWRVEWEQGADTLRVEVIQREPHYRATVDIEVQGRDCPEAPLEVILEEQVSTFAWTMPCKVTEVLVDPHFHVLHEETTPR